MQNFFIVCECYDVPPVLSSINSLKYYIILTQKIKIKCQLHGHLYQWIMKNCTIAKIWAISCINATHLVNTSVKYRLQKRQQQNMQNCSTNRQMFTTRKEENYFPTFHCLQILHLHQILYLSTAYKIASCILP